MFYFPHTFSASKQKRINIQSFAEKYNLYADPDLNSLKIENSVQISL